MAYLTKSTEQILSDAIKKLQSTTSITNLSPGSIVRALVEIITTELGDFYSILDLNTSQNAVATASGRSLDLFGSLFNVARKSISDIAVLDRSLGSFYFYTTTPVPTDVTVPAGTNIFTDTNTYVGRQYSYQTTTDTTIAAGHTRSWASIRPNYPSAPFTAGIGTLTVIDSSFAQPTGVFVLCTNPKPIQSQAVLESDDNYRSRILASVRTAAGGTLGAIRMAALAVTGVRDIAIRDTPYGLGSFEVLVVTDSNLTTLQTMADVYTALGATKPVGVRMYVRQPDTLPVDVTCSILLNADTPNIDRANTIRRTQTAVLRYLNTPLVGTPLIFNQLIQAILDATDYITDVVFSSFAINGVETLRKNYYPSDHEQLIPGAVLISIAN